jgi:Flp pilus assembly protein TadD
MPGKQARVLCPVCQEPIPPDETECENCGAFVIDEAVVRLGRAFGLKREAALKLVEMGFRHPRQLRDRDPDSVLQKGEVGLLFICTNCGGFVATGDTKCPRCAAEFEGEEAPPAPEEEDILDLVLCPVCGADNDPDLPECEICGERLREPAPLASVATTEAPPAPAPEARAKPPSPAIPSRLPTERPPPRTPSVIPAAPPRPSLTPGAEKLVRPRPVKAISKPTSDVRPAANMAETTNVRAEGPSPRAKSTERGDPRPGLSRAAAPALEIQALPQRKIRANEDLRIRGESQRMPPRSVIAPEIVGGIVLAAGAGLLLSGFLGQATVSAGIAAFLAGLLAYVVPTFVRSRVRIGRRDIGLLAHGVGLGVGGMLLTGSPVVGTVAAVASAIPFAWATRRLINTRARVVPALGSAVPLVVFALAAAQDPTLAYTGPWVAAVLAALPWPAALAASEVRRRQSTAVLRAGLVRAEKDIVQENYHRSLEEYDRAIAAARKGVPGAEIPWYGKGATLILLGRYDEALRAIDTALDINPHNEVAWVNKGNALSKMGRYVDALRCFNAAIKVNPRYEVAWNNKGNTLARLEKYEEALQCYERALGIDPAYRGAWVNKGFVLTRLGRFDEAASCADRALRLTAGPRSEAT